MDKQKNGLEKIYRLEKGILSIKQYSPAEIGRMIDYLDYYRRSYYKLLTRNKANQDIDLQVEYNKYCDFIHKLVTTKKFSRAMLAELIRHFVNNYQYILPFDSERISYDKTLDTLSGLKNDYTKCKNALIKNYGIALMQRSSRVFEYKYNANQLDVNNATEQ